MLKTLKTIIKQVEAGGLFAWLKLYWECDAPAGEDTKKTAQTLLDFLSDRDQWLGRWVRLMPFASATIRIDVRSIKPTSGAHAWKQIGILDGQGTRLFLVAPGWQQVQCRWFEWPRLGNPKFTKIPFSLKADFDTGEVGFPRRANVGEWADYHIAGFTSSAGVDFYPVVRQGDGTFSKILGFEVSSTVFFQRRRGQ